MPSPHVTVEIGLSMVAVRAVGALQSAPLAALVLRVSAHIVLALVDAWTLPAPEATLRVGRWIVSRAER